MWLPMEPIQKAIQLERGCKLAASRVRVLDPDKLGWTGDGSVMLDTLHAFSMPLAASPPAAATVMVTAAIISAGHSAGTLHSYGNAHPGHELQHGPIRSHRQRQLCGMQTAMGRRQSEYVRCQRQTGALGRPHGLPHGRSGHWRPRATLQACAAACSCFLMSADARYSRAG